MVILTEANRELISEIVRFNSVPVVPKVVQPDASVDNGLVPDTDRPKPHMCTFEGCTKMYYKNSHLKAHMRTHTGQSTRKDVQPCILNPPPPPKNRREALFVLLG